MARGSKQVKVFSGIEMSRDDFVDSWLGLTHGMVGLFQAADMYGDLLNFQLQLVAAARDVWEKAESK